MKLRSFFQNLAIIGGAFWSLCLWTAVGFSAAQPSALEALDRIAEKAGSLDGFLNSPQIQDEYFHALAKYYGESRFPRQSFDVILGQIKDLVAKVPEAKERIWRRLPSHDPSVIETLEAPEGVQLHAEGWQKYQSHWTDQLKKDSEPIRALPSEEARLAEVNRLFSRLGKRVQDFNLKLKSSGVSRRVQEAQSREFFLSLRNDADFKKATSYLVLEQIQHGKISEYFHSSDPSLVLYGLEELQKLQAPKGIEIPDSLQSLLKHASPSPESVLTDSNVFHLPKPEKGERSGRALKAQKWIFREPPRLLHTLWRGLPLNECVGGSCKWLDETTARRWAVSLLEGAQIQYLERGDHFLGYVQSVPAQLGSKRVASLEVMAPDMKRVALTRSGDGAAYSSKTLFNAWYSTAVKRLPEGTRGFAIGNAEGFHNGNGYAGIYSSGAFIQGSEIGSSAEFIPVDVKFEKKVAKSAPGGDVAKRYGGPDRMIFEGRDLNTEILTLLNPDSTSSDEAVHSVEAAKAIINGPVEGEGRLLASLAFQEWSPEMNELLKKERKVILEALRNEDLPAHKSAVELIKNAVPRALYTLFKSGWNEPATAKEFQMLAEEAKLFMMYRKNVKRVTTPLGDVFEERLIPFLSKKPSLDEIRMVRNAMREARSGELEILFMKEALKRVSNPRGFVHILNVNAEGSLTQVYSKMFNEFVHEVMPNLLQLNPSPEDLFIFMHYNGKHLDITNLESITREGLQRAKTADDFIAFATFNFKNPLSQRESELRKKLIQENAETFLKLHPSRTQKVILNSFAHDSFGRRDLLDAVRAAPACIVRFIKYRFN
ncbi:MAG: hypothetical protein ACJ763_13135 [Bdellovibrionia bacterium]